MGCGPVWWLMVVLRIRLRVRTRAGVEDDRQATLNGAELHKRGGEQSRRLG